MSIEENIERLNKTIGPLGLDAEWTIDAEHTYHVVIKKGPFWDILSENFQDAPLRETLKFHVHRYVSQYAEMQEDTPDSVVFKIGNIFEIMGKSNGSIV